MKTSVCFIAVAAAAMSPSPSLSQQLIDAPGRGYREQAGTEGNLFERKTDQSLRILFEKIKVQWPKGHPFIPAERSQTPFSKEWFELMNPDTLPPVAPEPPANKSKEPFRLRLGEPIPSIRSNP